METRMRMAARATGSFRMRLGGQAVGFNLKLPNRMVSNSTTQAALQRELI